MDPRAPRPPQPQYTLPLLAPLYSVLDVVSGPLPIPILALPLSILVLSHAVRVSYATCRVQSHPSSSRPTTSVPPSILKSVTLVWILLFGGWCTLAALLAQPSPLLIPDVHISALVYGGIHALCLVSGISARLVRVGETKLGGLSLDLIAALIDAVCRTDGITSLGIDSLSGTYLGGLSPLTLLVAPTLIGGGGPLLIGLFNLASPAGDWKLQMPPAWIRDPWQLGAIDIWSSALVGGAYALLSGDGRGQPITFFDKGEHYGAAGTTRPLLDKGEAKLLLSATLFLLLGGNRLRKHFGVGAKTVDEKSADATSAEKVQKDAKAPVESRRTARLLSLGLVLPVILIASQYLLAGDDFLVKKGWVYRVGQDPIGSFDYGEDEL